MAEEDFEVVEVKGADEGDKVEVKMSKEVMAKHGIKEGDKVVVQDVKGTIVVNKPSRKAYEKLAEIM